MSKLAINKRKLLATSVTAILIVTAVFSSLLWNTNNQTNDLKTQNTKLNNENTALADQNNALQSQINQLQNQENLVQQNENNSQNNTQELQAENNNLTAELSSLKEQTANLQSQLANLTTANLVAELKILDATGYQYNDLYISGSVGNTGQGTAYNAGLKVTAYSAQGILRINMTIPLVIGAFGIDAATSAVASTLPYQNVSLALGNVGTGVTLPVDVGIFHYDAVSNWTVTPVWTNQP